MGVFRDFFQDILTFNSTERFSGCLLTPIRHLKVLISWHEKKASEFGKKLRKLNLAWAFGERLMFSLDVTRHVESKTFEYSIFFQRSC